MNENKNKIEFEIIGEDHTLCNVLRNQLWKEDNVSISAYSIKHPLISNPIMLVETSKGDPKTAISNAVNSLKKELKEFKEIFSKKL